MPTYDPLLHHRQSLRLRGYDYARGGLYFITVCSQGRKCLFGSVEDGRMLLNAAGEMVEREWLALPLRFPHLQMHQWQVMPNHFHGIVEIREDDTNETNVGAPLVGAQSVSPRGYQFVSSHVSQSVSPSVTQSVSPRGYQFVSSHVSQSVSPGVTQSVSPGVTQSVSPGVTQSVSNRASDSTSADDPVSCAHNDIDAYRAPTRGAPTTVNCINDAGAPLVGAQRVSTGIHNVNYDHNIPVGAPLVGAQRVTTGIHNVNYDHDIPVGAPLVDAQRVSTGIHNVNYDHDGIGGNRAPTVNWAPTGKRAPTVNWAPTRGAPTLGYVIGAFKSLTTLGYGEGVKIDRILWQRNFYEHIIRSDESYLRISEYIENNPAAWAMDKLHPSQQHLKN